MLGGRGVSRGNFAVREIATSEREPPRVLPDPVPDQVSDSGFSELIFDAANFRRRWLT